MTFHHNNSSGENFDKKAFARHDIRHSYPLGRVRIFGVYCSSFRLLQLFLEFSVLSLILFVAFKIVGTGHAINGGILSVILSFIMVVCIGCMGLYSTRQSVVMSDLLQRLSISFLFSFVLMASVYWVLSWQIDFIESFAVPVSLAFVVLFVGRLATEKLIGRDSIMKKVLILGDGELADHVFNRLYSCSESAYSLHRLTVPGNLNSQEFGEEIIAFVSQHNISEIVLAYQEKRQQLPVSVLLECKFSGVQIRDPIEFLERESGLIDFDFLDMGWMMFSEGFNSDKLGILTKRVLDLVGSVTLLLVSAPLFVLAAVAIKLDRSSAGPIFYQQKRVGLDGKLFNVLKFRSMHTNAESNGLAQWAVENDPRVTSVGATLRKYRLDELPQLFNVLIGDMSLVGPRPERPEFVSQLSELHVLYGDRHRVKPGLTGWAQMRFPYTSSDNDSIKKLQYDMYYVKNRSLLLDFLILLQTVEVVLCGKGAR